MRGFIGSLSNHSSTSAKHNECKLLSLEFLDGLDFSLKCSILPAITDLQKLIGDFIKIYWLL